MPPLILVRFCVASIWLYEGLWCKVLGKAPRQEGIVKAVPLFESGMAAQVLVGLGYVEIALGAWFLSGWTPGWAAIAQTALLVPMNTVGLLYAREQIHDPAGMVLKNAGLLVLGWVAAGYVR